MDKDTGIIVGLVIVCLVFGLVLTMLFGADMREMIWEKSEKNLATQESVKMVTDNTIFVASVSLQRNIEVNIAKLEEVLQQGEIFQDASIADHTEQDFIAQEADLPNQKDINLSQMLEIFQEDHPQIGFVEILITDTDGVEIGKTRKTKDFFRGNTQWWKGIRDVRIGNIARDPQSGVLFVPVFFPARYKEGGDIFAVGRVILDVTALRRQ